MLKDRKKIGIIFRTHFSLASNRGDVRFLSLIVTHAGEVRAYIFILY